VAEVLTRGVRAIVHKHGSLGAAYHDATGHRFFQAFQDEEVDPTGAGDCFGGAFVSLWLRGEETRRAVVLAAVGALAVTKHGPMEGAARLWEITAFAAPKGSEVWWSGP
jgi:sugar/nucleoside kinase (ribokinase family)